MPKYISISLLIFALALSSVFIGEYPTLLLATLSCFAGAIFYDKF